MKKIYLLLITAVVACSNVFAQIGVIDKDFGTGGIVTTAYNALNMSGHTSALQSDGKIIMASGNGSNVVTLIRYTASGSPDNSFGINGKAVIATVTGSYLGGTVAALAVQADGKIIYAGNASDKIVLARLKPNGTPDSSFGTAGISFKGVAPAGWSSKVWSVIIKPDGKIVTGGTGTDGADKYYEVAQFKANGTVDSSFGTNGFYHYNSGLAGGCFSVALLPNGHLVAGGVIYNLIGSMSVINLFANGSVDSTYGTNGIATCLAYTNYRSLSCRVVVQPDNKVLALGYASYAGGQGIGLVRFRANGERDSGFAYLGTLTTTFKNFNDLPSNVSVQADGKLIITGSSSGKFALMRLKPNGTTDSTYGRLGKVVTDMQGAGSSVVSSFMQPDTKMVLTGITKIGGIYSFIAGRFERIPISYYNTLKGSFFSDDNHNGTRDNNEVLLSNVKTSIKKGQFDWLSAISSKGQFYLPYLDTGTYVTNAIIQSSCYSTPIPANHVTSNTTYFNTDSVTFAMQPSPCYRDVAIDLVYCRSARPRPGSIVSYLLFYRNVGTDIAAGTFEFIKNPKLTLNSVDQPPASISGDTIRWNFSGLLPQQSIRIYLYLTVKLPPLANIGDSLNSVASIKSDTAYEQNLQNNVSRVKQIIVGSFDPNNKIENHGGKITPQAVAAGEYLTYTVNFQNTGTDTAYNIFIHDTLSNLLDWSTLEMVGASADYELTMSGGKCVWTFNNIYLPDSNVNLAASNGFVSFRIKPKATVQLGDIINNTAAIYFDYNLPIFTNTETTTIASDALPLKLLSFTAKKEGRGEVLLNWSTANEINVDRFDVERSGNGRDFVKTGVIKAGLARYNFTDYLPLAAHNFYRLKMLDKDGQFSYSPVRMINNTGTCSVSIYPNPAKDNLQLQIDSDKPTALQVQVLSMDGKVLLSNNVSEAQGVILRSINISPLPKGSYFLKVISTNGDKEEQVIKFEKL